MTTKLRSSSPEKKRQRWKHSVAGWFCDRSGTTALEFSIIAIPFFLFCFAVLGSSLYFFTSNSLEWGVESAARKIRTGETKQAGTSIGDFRQLVCNEVGSSIDCNKLSVLIQSGADWSELTPQSCLDGNNQMVTSTGAVDDLVDEHSGEASFVTLVTLCYEWDLAKTFEFLKLGIGSDGSGPAVIQASTAFRIEPHPYE